MKQFKPLDLVPISELISTDFSFMFRHINEDIDGVQTKSAN